MLPFSLPRSVRCWNPAGRVVMALEITLDSCPFVPCVFAAVMKFAAGERMNAFAEESKKTHGLSGAKAENVGGANVPLNERWFRFCGYWVRFGNANEFAAAAQL